MTDAFSRAAKRSLRRSGRAVTLVNGMNPTRDPDHGDYTWDDDPTDTVAEVVYRGTPAFAKRADGVGASIEAVAWVVDDDPVTAGEDDDMTKATRIQDGGSTLVVRDVFDETNGLLRCHCEVEA